MNAKYKNIAKKILDMTEKDQEMRKKWAKSGFDSSQYNAKLDDENTVQLNNIVEQIGWPTTSKVGEKASVAAWVLVQHSPSRKFQKQMLHHMQSEGDDTQKPLVAKLIDRIRIINGKPQLYGTSFTSDNITGKLSVDPIEDIENIDARRKEMGLDLFEDQKKRAFDSYREYREKLDKNK